MGTLKQRERPVLLRGGNNSPCSHVHPLAQRGSMLREAIAAGKEAGRLEVKGWISPLSAHFCRMCGA